MNRNHTQVQGIAGLEFDNGHRCATERGAGGIVEGGDVDLGKIWRGSLLSCLGDRIEGAEHL